MGFSVNKIYTFLWIRILLKGYHFPQCHLVAEITMTLVAENLTVIFFHQVSELRSKKSLRFGQSNEREILGFQSLMVVEGLRTFLNCLWKTLFFCCCCCFLLLLFRKVTLVTGEKTNERRSSSLNIKPLVPNPSSTWRNYRKKASTQGKHCGEPL